MTSSNIFYSIVIVTCDRVEILEPTLRSLTLIDYDNFEIVVSDNHSADGTADVVKKIQAESNTQIRYVRTDKRLDMASHCDFAYKNASADYIILCGDDDFLSPYIFKYANDVISKNNTDLLIWRIGNYYHKGWSLDFTHPRVSSKENVIQASKTLTKKLYSLKKDQMIKNFCQFNYSYFPNFGNFIFKKEVGVRIEKETGRFFWPLAPDYTSTLLLVCNAENIHFMDIYGSFGGRSLKSNYHSLLTREEKGRVIDFMDEFGDTDFVPFHEPKIPSYWNYVAAPIAIAREYYPDKMGKYDVDLNKLIEKVYSEYFAPFERLPHWGNKNLINVWNDYFLSAGFTQQKIESIAENASLLKEQTLKNVCSCDSELLELTPLGINDLTNLMLKFTNIQPFLNGKKQQGHSGTLKNAALEVIDDQPLAPYDA